ncbi:hypothetical protein DFH09DRAFT_567261 [Mycena vulgaris]|nr:hypothetical protein DFH09DRAFT_567261 [Mycena vulgaris]
MLLWPLMKQTLLLTGIDVSLTQRMHLFNWWTQPSASCLCTAKMPSVGSDGCSANRLFCKSCAFIAMNNSLNIHRGEWT